MAHNLRALLGMGEDAVKGIGKIGTFGKEVVKITYFLPTRMRQRFNKYDHDSKFREECGVHKQGIALSNFFGSVIGYLGHCLIDSALNGDVTEYSLIPFGTHALSGGYEWLRHKKNQIREQQEEQQGFNSHSSNIQ